MIQIENLSKSFGSNRVLKDVNIVFEKGKVYGIMGDNGAGKTTLFRCIAGFEKHEGNILSDVSPLKNHLGLLNTEPYFFPKMTGREYIKLLANARKKNIDDIDSVNVFELPLDQYALNYSTGMKKKLALTALLFLENQYFILDEPFNGVDIHSNIIITEIILKLKKLNKLILISSHIFSTLSDTCDEILILKNGTFIRRAQKEAFKDLETDLKEFTIGSKIDKLNLS